MGKNEEIRDTVYGIRDTKMRDARYEDVIDVGDKVCVPGRSVARERAIRK